MRHLGRVHGVSIGFLHEQYRDNNMRMEYITTSLMAADIFTKAFSDGSKWNNLCHQINIVAESVLMSGDLFAHFCEYVNGQQLSGSDKMPEVLQGLDSGYGVHNTEDGCEYEIIREPKLFRTHKDRTFCILGQISEWLDSS